MIFSYFSQPRISRHSVELTWMVLEALVLAATLDLVTKTSEFDSYFSLVLLYFKLQSLGH